MRKYFVSYFFEGKKGNTGHGCTELEVGGLIRDFEVINLMADYIRKKNKFKKVAILNWRRFEEPQALLSERSGV